MRNTGRKTDGNKCPTVDVVLRAEKGYGGHHNTAASISDIYDSPC